MPYIIFSNFLLALTNTLALYVMELIMTVKVNDTGPSLFCLCLRDSLKGYNGIDPSSSTCPTALKSRRWMMRSRPMRSWGSRSTGWKLETTSTGWKLIFFSKVLEMIFNEERQFVNLISATRIFFL